MLPYENAVGWALQHLPRPLPPAAHVDDLKQVGRIKLWQIRDKLEELEKESPKHAENYACLAAERAMIDYMRSMWLRHSGRERVVVDSMDGEETSPMDLMASADDPRSEAQVRQLIANIERRIRKKSSASTADQQLIVLDCLVEGLPWSEAGKITGISEAMFSHHRTAIRKIVAEFVD